jgi:periplasmic divalent cation tolerance protein
MSTTPDKTASDLLIVLSTFPNSDDAGTAAHTLVEECLCACVNILPGVRSVYRWGNQVANNGEVLCLIKTPRARHAELVARLIELHAYDVPEVVTLTAADVNDPYLRWVLQETDPNRAPSSEANEV